MEEFEIELLLRDVAGTFRQYEAHHRARAADPMTTLDAVRAQSLEKAERNRRMAERCETALREREDSVARLRRIVARYGDRIPMATCHRQDWQHEIDAALEFVANNPEEPQHEC